MLVGHSCPSLPVKGVSQAHSNAPGVAPKTADQAKAQGGTDQACPGQPKTGGREDGMLGPNLDVPRASAGTVGERVTSSRQHAVRTGSAAVRYDRQMSAPLQTGSSLCFHYTYRASPPIGKTLP